MLFKKSGKVLPICGICGSTNSAFAAMSGVACGSRFFFRQENSRFLRAGEGCVFGFWLRDIDFPAPVPELFFIGLVFMKAFFCPVFLSAHDQAGS